MRIIGGLSKGVRLFQPKDKETRPLKDLTKESIFNTLIHNNDLNVLKNELIGFIHSLNKGKFEYTPALKGVTKIGESINLGFNCYVIKCLYMLDEWVNLNTSLANCV